MTEPQFQAWPKIARLNRDIVVSEKLDGTNGAIQIVPGHVSESQHGWVAGVFSDSTFYKVAAQSRNRIITTDNDNYGFAQWVQDNATELVSTLGEGTHYGEWWGRKIARAYDKTDRTFSLFNTSRWTEENTKAVEGLSVVPTLWFGGWDGPGMSDGAVEYALSKLRREGSLAAPGFPNPEGVVIFHTASNVMFKVTIENDEKPKGQV